jgi:hypothetical protein
MYANVYDKVHILASGNIEFFPPRGKLRKPENERKKLEQVNAHERTWSVLATDRDHRQAF